MAVEELRRAIELKPDYTEAHYNMGVVLEMKGEISGAIIKYKDALKINSDHEDARNRLKIALRKNGV
jgi:protein O-GlcNAc transferase